MPASLQLVENGVLLGIVDPVLYEQLSEALCADGIAVLQATSGAEAFDLARTKSPSLIVLEHSLPGDGLETCQAIRKIAEADTPIIIVAAREDINAGDAAGVSDWLIRPFSAIYAQTRMRAWLMRTTCRWTQPPFPASEAERLTALYRLAILDTEREERFDRLTRIAAAAFEVPIALVSLVDTDRQWFKSACGADITETPRDMSFCAHAIVERSIMVIPDALLDPRFADNPIVVNDPRVRFYAGCPLVLHSGACVGTLCLIDTRPRQLDEAGIRLLKDLAGLVLEELQRAPSLTAHSK
jgi:GAF domain-containing protein